MANFTEALSPKFQEFLRAAPIYFVASSHAKGRINLSPKGMDTLRVVDEKTVAYLDLTGSGNETAAHIKHDGRLTLMACSFGETPLILRLYGQGRVIGKDAADWDAWLGRFKEEPGTRQIIVLDIESIQSSCGFAVPIAQEMAERPRLRESALKKGDDGMIQYRVDNNQVSIDGLEIGIQD